jgi:sugar-specific transcriptional regulator TrmB
MNTYLNDNEKRVLGSLYRMADFSVRNIAKETLINRTTLYPILEKLTEKGLVSKIKLEGKIVFQPISKDEFKLWAERREADMKKGNEDMLAWIGEHEKNQKVTLASDMKYFEGMEGIRTLYADTWRDNPEKMIYCLTDYENGYGKMRDFFEKEYFPERIKRQVRIKNLVPKSAEARKHLKTVKAMLREMKFIKLFKDLDIEINIYNNKVSIVAFDRQNPSGVIIKNQKIAEAMKEIFNYLWATKQ